MPFSQPRKMSPRRAHNLRVGGRKRKLVRIGETMSFGVSMSKDKLGKRELGPGDDIVMLPDDSPHPFEYHLPRQDA